MTGGSSHLGVNILKRARADWQIAATYFTYPLASENVAAFRVDVRDADMVNRLFDQFRPDAVIHTAAQMDGDTIMYAQRYSGTGLGTALRLTEESFVFPFLLLYT